MANGNKAPIGQMSIDTQTLIDMLEKAPVGAQVTYEEMNAATHRDIQRERWPLASARRHLEGKGVVYAAVESVGVERLDDVGVVQFATHDMRSITRKARRGGRRLSHVKANDLSPELRTKHAVHLAVFGAIAATGRRDSIKKLTAVCANSPKQIMSREAMLALWGNGEKRSADTTNTAQ